MKIGFYLLGEKAFRVFEGFINRFNTESISFIVIGEDQNVVNDFSYEIKKIAEKHSVKSSNRGEVVSDLADYSFAIGWRWLIDTSNLIVFHDSLLPSYRGFSPLVNMLINGEKNLGVTALMAVDEYDKGPILMQESISICYPIKIQEAIELVSQLYVKMALNIANLILTEARIPLTEQNHSEASYSLWRDDLDYAINWKESSNQILRFINAVGYPFEGASSYLNGLKVRILSADIYNDVKIEARVSHIGKVIFLDKGESIVVCGEGLLKITYINNDSNSEKIEKIPFRSRFT